MGLDWREAMPDFSFLGRSGQPMDFGCLRSPSPPVAVPLPEMGMPDFGGFDSTDMGGFDW